MKQFEIGDRARLKANLGVVGEVLSVFAGMVTIQLDGEFVGNFVSVKGVKEDFEHVSR